ncbi:16927_t:CDS:1, partial [Gigaspora rosea]
GIHLLKFFDSSYATYPVPFATSNAVENDDKSLKEAGRIPKF